MLDPIKHLLTVADAFCLATNKSRSTVSTAVFNDGKTLDKIANGADMNIGRHANAMRWFSDNWPEKTRWPAGIKRPQKSQQVA